ncbi:hypothetical protein N7452_006017 [Penicillium brevicompactum]|uniref:Uncharacterized protein n=1 Tax=Penicillium brevicompactum TaxID=5074 RepID=A0A9W9UG90_PENBR|nr:hypothetical protein N7452_006017 [Penicillium brevicompactum]
MVYNLFSMVNDKDGVLRAMSAMPSEVKNESWFPKVKSFIDSQLCQYLGQAQATKKFPAVKIPSSSPGLDIMCALLDSETEDYKLNVVFSRTTASQLHLDLDMQALAKAGYLEYWSNVLKNADTKNQPGPSEEMRNTLYKNLAADSYNLLLPDFQEMMPEDTVIGYTEMELIAYIVFMMMVASKRERTNFLHLDYHDSSDVDKKRVSELIKVKVMNMLKICLIAE